jgi:hypothetical protein
VEKKSFSTANVNFVGLTTPGFWITFCASTQKEPTMGKHLTSYSTARTFLKEFLKAFTGYDCHQIELIPSDDGGPDTILILLHQHKLPGGAMSIPNPYATNLGAYNRFITHFGRCPYVIESLLVVKDQSFIDAAPPALRSFLVAKDGVNHI